MSCDGNYHEQIENGCQVLQLEYEDRNHEQLFAKCTFPTISAQNKDAKRIKSYRSFFSSEFTII